MKYFIDFRGIDETKEFTDPYDALYEILDYIGIAKIEVFPSNSFETKEQEQVYDVLLDYYLKNKSIVMVIEQDDEDSSSSYFDSMYESKNNY